jgi:hypothetical protein
MVRQNELSTVAYVEIIPNLDTQLAQSIDFFEKRFRLDHASIADDAGHTGMKDSRRDDVQNELPVVHDDRVTGVMTSPVAHDDLNALGEKIHVLPFSFVAPLSSHNDDVRHNLPHNRSFDGRVYQIETGMTSTVVDVAMTAVLVVIFGHEWRLRLKGDSYDVEKQLPRHPRPARGGDFLQGLAAGSGPSYAHEQLGS